MRKLRTLELAKVGKWGQDGAEITRQDLADVVETFAGKRPVVIGHDGAQDDKAPKFGDVLDVRLNGSGNTLIGDTLFLPEAEGLYADGHYDGWSVSIPRRAADEKRYLHHLAILGAVPPKIPGLKELSAVPMNYADGDKSMNIQFSGKIPEEEAVNPEEMKKRIQELETENADLKKKLEAVPPSAAPETAKEKAFADELAKVRSDFEKQKTDGFVSRVTGKVPAGILPKAKAVAEKMIGATAFDFADGDKTRNVEPITLFEEILTTWPAAITPGRTQNDYSDAKGADGKVIDWNALAQKA